MVRRSRTSRSSLGGIDFERQRRPHCPAQPYRSCPRFGHRRPAPLGLAAFALTTLLLSAKNTDWMSHSTTSAWLGFAFAYGGLGQFAAGMWEFRRGNTFGATAFSSYGGFWIGLGLWSNSSRTRRSPIRPATLASTVTALNHDLGWIALAFAILTIYLLLLSAQVNLAVFLVFLLLAVTLRHPGHR